MDDIYKFPVYFECRRISEEEKGRIEKYFLNRRKSGGGECQPVEEIRDNVFRTAFCARRDQQSVLQRMHHVVHLAGGSLELTVKESLEAQTSNITSTFPPAEAIPPSPPPPSGEDCESHPGSDHRESLQAKKEPDNDPDSSSCSASFHAEGEFLVQSFSEDQVGNSDVDISEDFNRLSFHRARDERSPVNSTAEGEEDGPSVRLTESSRPGGVEFHMDSAAQLPERRASNGGRVHIQMVRGTMENQEVDAVVSPMMGDDPTSTRIGKALHAVVGSQLTARFKEAAGQEVLLAAPVLVENLPRLPSGAVFFLSLCRWNDDPNGTAVELLKMGVDAVLTSCDSQGFESVAFPVLGAGIVFSFPIAVVAKVLLEGIYRFQRQRTSSKPLAVRIVVHSDDKESSEVFKAVQEEVERNLSQEPSARRIVLLGKTGCGKSSLANIMLGENLFAAIHSPSSGTRTCQSETRHVDDRSITVIDTPGFFDTHMSEKDLKPEIMRCIAECAPGIHAFLILLKVERFSEQEEAVVTRICDCFSEDALKHAVLVFTFGNELPTGMKIEDFVRRNHKLSDLLNRCGGRCHVFDNKHWNGAEQNGYRSNCFQREALLNTVDELVMERNGECYTNQTLQDAEQEIQEEEKRIQQSPVKESVAAIRNLAKSKVLKGFVRNVAGIGTGALLGAFLGVEAHLNVIISTAAHKNVMLTVGVAACVAAKGAVLGGIAGQAAAQQAETPMDAMEKAANAVMPRR